MAWEDVALNAYLEDFDLSEDRDRAIEERAAELLADDGPKGYAPFSAEVMLVASEKFDSEDLLSILRPYLVAGDHAGAGLAVVQLLKDVAEKESAEVARIQIDREHMEK
jgi:hypothetical protein